MSDTSDRILEVALAAGRQAATICRQVQARVPSDKEAMAKVGKEPVTVADYSSQAVILRQVAQAFPQHGVIAEEGADHLRQNAEEALRDDLEELIGTTLGGGVSFDQICAWIDHKGEPAHELTWVIDPIDGTKGFLRRQQYAVAIGLLKDRQPWAGVLVCPNLPYSEGDEGETGVLFAAVRGEGARKMAIDSDRSEAIAVSDSEPAAARILGSVESSHGDPRVLTGVLEDAGLAGVVRIDSQAKYGLVASAGAEIYLRPQSRPDYRERIWDHAAGVLVVEEAGGRVTDLDGKPLDFTRGARLEDNRGIVATNGRIHDRILESIALVEREATG